MRAGWGLAFPWLLLLLLCPGSAKPVLEYVAEQDIGRVLSSRDMRQDDDVDYDSFVGLMGRRSTGTDVVPPIRRNWDIDDIFVGLLGRRNSDSDVPPWRREKFFTKNKTFR